MHNTHLYKIFSLISLTSNKKIPVDIIQLLDAKQIKSIIKLYGNKHIHVPSENDIRRHDLLFQVIHDLGTSKMTFKDVCERNQIGRWDCEWLRNRLKSIKKVLPLHVNSFLFSKKVIAKALKKINKIK